VSIMIFLQIGAGGELPIVSTVTTKALKVPRHFGAQREITGIEANKARIVSSAPVVPVRLARVYATDNQSTVFAFLPLLNVPLFIVSAADATFLI